MNILTQLDLKSKIMQMVRPYKLYQIYNFNKKHNLHYACFGISRIQDSGKAKYKAKK